jgi:hypothetical protein
MDPLATYGSFEAVLPPAKSAGTFSYYIVAYDSSGMDSRVPYDAPHSFYSVRIASPAVSGVRPSEVPAEFSLEQNYPNPFNPTTTVVYTLPEACRITVRIFDLLGRTVATLADGVGAAGRHSVQWNSRASGGIPVSSGTYLYRIEAAGLATGSRWALQRKMLLLK